MAGAGKPGPPGDEARKKVIIDTDPGIDDAMAIFVALRSPELEVLGLTTTFGNVHTALATRNALHLLEAVGRTDIPVAEGSHVTIKVSSTPTHLFFFIHREVNITISAVELDPSFPKKIGQIIILGGAYSVNGNVNPAAEANIFGDPDAADIVFTCGADILAVGLNVTHQVVLTDADREKLEQCDSKYARYLCKIMGIYFDYHKDAYFIKGFYILVTVSCKESRIFRRVYLHDPTTLIAAVNPSLLTYTEGIVRVQTVGITRGLTVFDNTKKRYAEVTPWTGKSTVKVAVTVDAPAVVELMMQRLIRQLVFIISLKSRTLSLSLDIAKLGLQSMAAAVPRKKLIIDTDPGIDDAMAIFVALRSPELEVLGLTTTFGNVHTPLATRNALHLVRSILFLPLETVGRTDVPVAEGSHVPIKKATKIRIASSCHGSDGLGNQNFPAPVTKPVGQSAAAFLVEQATLHPGQVTVVALGPLTNLAQALELDPSFAKKIRQIVILGGTYSVNGNINPAAESNLNDWHGLADADREKLEQSDSKYARYLGKILRHYFDYHRDVYLRKGVYLHDPTALLAAVDPSLMTYTEGVVRVQTVGITKGLTVFNHTKKRYAAITAWSGLPTVKIAVTVDAPAVVEMMMQRLTTDD
ncbi:hypothetical protein PR202_gb26775 [Eleusine coracana subsp. coracana]|uniref:Inosine/uridine-preferring nucleoside hydrolase domain-containing protein n=1 Tax=Eleusine coracana subsp. coracana TaxID=191504 RepID=A0AAV5FU55_ELECO|nr:hypothetical protein PR202_gb26775 [Eleusine coracana subsp. coracana]